jgi:aminoglycoside 6'-N-acetyltransferase
MPSVTGVVPPIGCIPISCYRLTPRLPGQWDHPFGYIQCYALTTWNQGLGAHPLKTRDIGQFIGDPDMIGRGHGSGLIGQFVEGLLRSGSPRVVTDPNPHNGRAVRAYAKAGFQNGRIVATPDGSSLLMIRNP